MEARISSARVRTTKGLLIYSLCFFISFYYLSGRSRRGAHGARPCSPPPPPFFLDRTEARRAEKKFQETGPPHLSRGLDDRARPLLAPLSQCLDPALLTLTG